MYLHSRDTTENLAAPGNGSVCDDPATATPECFDWQNWGGGWVGETITNIFRELNPPEVIAMTRANFSDEVYEEYKGGSSYTRCVYEIRLDNVDICVGDFWETSERRKLVPFSSQMLGDTMKIVSVPRGFKASEMGSEGETIDWAIMYRTALQPFSNETWFILMGMLVFGGIMMWVCEYNVEDSPLENEGVNGLFKTIWVSAMSLVCTSAAHEATHWPGRIAQMGFAFFIYVVVALYVSSLASFLVLKPAAGAAISNLPEIARLGGKLCLLEAMSGAVEYAVPVQNQHKMDDYGPALEKLYRGGCSGALLGFFQFDQFVRSQTASFSVCIDPEDENGWSSCTTVPTDAVRIDLNCKCEDPTKDIESCPSECPFGAKRYCPLVEVVDPSFSLSLAFAVPLKPFLQNYISAWIIRYRQSGTMEKSINTFARSKYCDVCGQPYSADDCVQKNAEAAAQPKNAAGPEFEQLDLEYMAGVFVIPAGIMVLGGLVSIMSRVYERFATTPETPMMDVDVYERDADLTELVKVEGRNTESAMFHRKLEEQVDKLTTQMDSMTERIRQLEHST